MIAMRHERTMMAIAIAGLLVGCGDPKGTAGAIGVPAASQDPSKMDKKAPGDSKMLKQTPSAPSTLKATPTSPDADDKQGPRAGDGSVRPTGGDAAQKVTPQAPVDAKVDVEAKAAPQ
jgi:hypothetical protein